MQPSIQSNHFEDQKEQLVDSLAKIDSLLNDVQQSRPGDDLSTAKITIEVLVKEVENVLLQPFPPVGVSSETYESAMKLFLQLPVSLRLALVKALDMDDEAAGDYRRIPEIVSRLYEENQVLTPKRLTDSLKAAQSKEVGVVSGTVLQQSKSAVEILTNFYERDGKQSELNSEVKLMLGRLSRRSELCSPTEDDLKILTDALDSSTFVSNCKPINIPGGYAIPGQNRKRNTEDLLHSLDSSVPNAWDCTVSCIPNLLTSDDEDMSERGNMLILFKDEFLPSNRWLYNMSTICALATTLSFAFETFGSDGAVLSQLGDFTSLGEYSGSGLLDIKVVELVLPLFVILLSHELGHYYVSRKEKIEITFPTLLPFPNTLPLMGSVTRITSPPSNLTALFDFAISGPVLGFISSFGFLFAGLHGTEAALDGSSNAVEIPPTLPVSVLKLSTLGGSIIDFFYGGGGFVTSQDVDTPVPLHPFFIAGFCGLLINAAEMLPLGATDGGRLSLSLFGRQGHAVVSGFTWFTLLVSSFALAQKQGDVVVTAWLINSFVQNDMEIPCRDETDNVDPARAVMCFTLWFLAVLALVPMN